MKTVMTGVLALALLASAAPAALAQDRPDRQNEDGSRGQGRPQEHPHQAPPPAGPPAGAQPAPHAAPPPPPAAATGGQIQAGPRGYYRSDDHGGYRGSAGGQGQGQGQPTPAPTQPPARGPGQYQGQSQYQGQPSTPYQGQRQGQDGRNDGHYGGQRDAGRPAQGEPQPAYRDDRFRQDGARRDDGRRDDGRRHDDRGRDEGRRYNDGRGPGQDWQRDRPRYDRHEYPFEFSGHQRYRGFSYYPPRGFYVRHWGFGDIVPRAWWGQDYRLNDWWSYGLPIPPIGYEWVRVGDDALLVDIYSGRVVQVAYDIFY